jgi:hypothetical protein
MTSTYYVQIPNHDYTINSVTGVNFSLPYSRAGASNVIFPNFTEASTILIYTAPIGATPINNAKLLINEYSYSATPKLVKDYKITIWTGMGYATLTNANGIVYQGGVREIPLTPTEIGYISTSGYTLINVSMNSVTGSMQFRNFQFNAYETSQATAPRIVINEPEPTKENYIRITDAKRLNRW